jgi:hypothetical protein
MAGTTSAITMGPVALPPAVSLPPAASGAAPAAEAPPWPPAAPAAGLPAAPPPLVAAGLVAAAGSGEAAPVAGVAAVVPGVPPPAPAKPGCPGPGELSVPGGGAVAPPCASRRLRRGGESRRRDEGGGAGREVAAAGQADRSSTQPRLDNMQCAAGAGTGRCVSGGSFAFAGGGKRTTRTLQRGANLLPLSDDPPWWSESRSPWWRCLPPSYSGSGSGDASGSGSGLRAGRQKRRPGGKVMRQGAVAWRFTRGRGGLACGGAAPAAVRA